MIPYFLAFHPVYIVTFVIATFWYCIWHILWAQIPRTQTSSLLRFTELCPDLRYAFQAHNSLFLLELTSNCRELLDSWVLRPNMTYWFHLVRWIFPNMGPYWVLSVSGCESMWTDDQLLMFSWHICSNVWWTSQLKHLQHWCRYALTIHQTLQVVVHHHTASKNMDCLPPKGLCVCGFIGTSHAKSHLRSSDFDSSTGLGALSHGGTSHVQQDLWGRKRPEDLGLSILFATRCWEGLDEFGTLQFEDAPDLSEL